jgi:hypothetical protein
MCFNSASGGGMQGGQGGQPSVTSMMTNPNLGQQAPQIGQPPSTGFQAPNYGSWSGQASSAHGGFVPPGSPGLNDPRWGSGMAPGAQLADHSGVPLDHNQATASGGMFNAPQNPAQHTPAWAQQPQAPMQQAPQQPQGGQYQGLLQMLQQYMQPGPGLAPGVDPRVASFNRPQAEQPLGPQTYFG